MNEPTTNENLELEDWLEVGTIVAPQGLRGELRVYPNSDFPERFEQPGKRWLQLPDSPEMREVELLQGRYVPGKNLYVVRLAGVDDRDRAEALRNAKLLVPASDRPQLAAEEYHIRDLIGLEVVDRRTGVSLGEIISVLQAGNDLLEVKLHATAVPETVTPKHKKKKKKARDRTLLIPFVKAIVPEVNLAARRIEIFPPEGLLELNE